MTIVLLAAFTIIVLAMATEAVTEIMVDSEFPLFSDIREMVARIALPDTPRNDLKHRSIVFFHRLISCGYCFSVWVAAFFALFSFIIIPNPFINWVCHTFLIHRLSNMIHVSYELLRKGRVKTYDIALSLSKDSESDSESDLVETLKGD